MIKEVSNGLRDKKGTRPISTRVTEEEYRTLNARAVKRGQSLSDYMRWVLLRRH